MSFGGLDYDGDEDAGEKLDAVVRQVQSHCQSAWRSCFWNWSSATKATISMSTSAAVISHEDDAQRALLAALDFKSLPQEFDFLRDLKIGVTSGTLRVLEPTAVPPGAAFGALGDEVNLAARLMTAADTRRNPGFRAGVQGYSRFIHL